MKRSPTPWKTLALLLAAAAACSGESRIDTDVSTAPPEADESAASPAAVVAPPAANPAAAAPKAETAPAAASPGVPLEKLLQVPGAAAQRPAEPDIDELLRRKPDADPVVAGETATERRVRLEFEARTHAPIERPDLKREQVDAGAKVDLSKDTSIRGGVRVERDSSDSKPSDVGATTRVGIEKRF